MGNLTAVTTGMNRLLDEMRGAPVCDFQTAGRSAASLVALLANNLPHAATRGGIAPWQKRKVDNYIESSLEGPLLIAELANLVSLSASHFCRAFKDSVGEPPHAYITRKRIERAKTLMLTTAESLSQIALFCGFADQSHFCRSFRHATGAPPSVWRRDHSEISYSGRPIKASGRAAFGSIQVVVSQDRVRFVRTGISNSPV